MDLMRRAKGGDQQAFGELYEQYLTPVYRYIYLRVKHASTAEDLTQQVFLKVFASLERYQEQGKPLAYFFTVARNSIADHWRKKKPIIPETPVEESYDLEAKDEQIEERLDRDNAIEHIKTHIQTLPPAHQDILILRFIEERTTKEIAQITGKNEAAIRQTQSRALKKLRSLIDRDIV